MKIKIPNNKNQEQYIENKASIVLIGANGSGKTRMSVWIDENNQDISIHRISAQKSLSMPKFVSPTEMSMAEEEFLYGQTNKDKEWLKKFGKKNSRWGGSPETFMLNDYEKLMKYLMTENYEKNIEYRENHKQGKLDFDNSTWLEKIKEIWDNVISHRELKICAGKIEVTESNENTYYNGSEMSDGERAIFHFAGEVLCAKKNSLIIVDEPENHLHRSILIRLWDAIESSRTDCTFLYITHNLEFARSRINSQVIWVKSFIGENKWEYELLDGFDTADSLKLEVLGNRQKVLLIEGTKTKSIDIKLYSKVYKEYNVLPLESCNSVIQATKAYNKTNALHYIEVRGIVDRDRRDNDEIIKLRENNIFVPDVSEIENLFLLEDVIRIVAEKQDKDNVEEIISDTQNKVFDFLNKEIANQALLFTKQKSQNHIVQKINEKASTIEEYISKLNELSSNEIIQSIYNEEIEKMNEIIRNKDYSAALQIINNKGLLTHTDLPKKFGWKKDFYIDYVLLLLDKNDSIGNKLRYLFRQHISEL